MNNTLLKELTDIDFKKILELIDKKEIPDNFDNLKDNVYRFNLDEITQNYIFVKIFESLNWCKII